MRYEFLPARARDLDDKWRARFLPRLRLTRAGPQGDDQEGGVHFLKLAAGQASGPVLFMTGKLRLEGDVTARQPPDQLLQDSQSP